MEIKVFSSNNSPGFSLVDENRRYFSPAFSKLKFKEALFGDGNKKLMVAENFDEIDMLNGVLNVKFDNLEKVKGIKYVLIEMGGVDKYYFCTNVVIKSEIVATLVLRLDTITTYLDQMKPGYSVINRQHAPPSIASDSNMLKVDDFEVQKSVATRVERFDIEERLKTTYSDEIKKLFYHDNVRGYLYAIVHHGGKGFSRITNVWSKTLRIGKTPYLVVPVGNWDGKKDIWEGGSNWKDERKYLRNSYHDLIDSPYVTNILYSKFQLFANYYPVRSAYGVLDDNLHVDDNIHWFGYDVVTYPNIIKTNLNIHMIALPYDLKLYTSQFCSLYFVTPDREATELDMTKFFHEDEGQSWIIALTLELMITPVNILAHVSSMPGTTQYELNRNLLTLDGFTEVDSAYPALSSPYQDYLNTNISKQKAEKENSLANLISGVALSFITAGASLFMKNPAGMAKSAGGASDSVVGYVNTLNTVNARLDDVSRSPATPISVRQGVFINMLQRDELNDFRMVLVQPNHSVLRVYDKYYKMYGYLDKEVRKIDYNLLMTRPYFTYTKINDFRTTLKNSDFPNEVIDDISNYFMEGVRLWNTSRVADYSLNNNHQDEDK